MNSVGHGLTQCAQIAERDDKMTRQMVERESKMTEMLEKLMAKMDRVSTYGPCCIYKPTFETPICSEQRRCSRFFFLQFPWFAPWLAITFTLLAITFTLYCCDEQACDEGGRRV